MGCNCGKNKSRTASAAGRGFLLKMPDGRRSEHNTKMEAQAENARRGGGGKVVPKR